MRARDATGCPAAVQALTSLELLKEREGKNLRALFLLGIAEARLGRAPESGRWSIKLEKRFNNRGTHQKGRL